MREQGGQQVKLDGSVKKQQRSDSSFAAELATHRGMPSMAGLDGSSLLLSVSSVRPSSLISHSSKNSAQPDCQFFCPPPASKGICRETGRWADGSQRQRHKRQEEDSAVCNTPFSSISCPRISKVDLPRLEVERCEPEPRLLGVLLPRPSPFLSSMSSSGSAPSLSTSKLSVSSIGALGPASAHSAAGTCGERIFGWRVLAMPPRQCRVVTLITDGNDSTLLLLVPYFVHISVQAATEATGGADFRYAARHPDFPSASGTCNESAHDPAVNGSLLLVNSGRRLRRTQICFPQHPMSAPCEREMLELRCEVSNEAHVECAGSEVQRAEQPAGGITWREHSNEEGDQQAHAMYGGDAVIRVHDDVGCDEAGSTSGSSSSAHVCAICLEVLPANCSEWDMDRHCVAAQRAIVAEEEARGYITSLRKTALFFCRVSRLIRSNPTPTEAKVCPRSPSLHPLRPVPPLSIPTHRLTNTHTLHPFFEQAL
eukprot:2793910-Rhodomonas_salina.2